VQAQKIDDSNAIASLNIGIDDSAMPDRLRHLDPLSNRAPLDIPLIDTFSLTPQGKSSSRAMYLLFLAIY
jgi:hypothetical protein